MSVGLLAFSTLKSYSSYNGLLYSLSQISFIFSIKSGCISTLLISLLIFLRINSSSSSSFNNFSNYSIKSIGLLFKFSSRSLDYSVSIPNVLFIAVKSSSLQGINAFSNLGCLDNSSIKNSSLVSKKYLLSLKTLLALPYLLVYSLINYSISGGKLVLQNFFRSITISSVLSSTVTAALKENGVN